MDFLANHPIPDNWELSEELSNEGVFVIDAISSWKMFFDGVANQQGAGASVIFITPKGDVILYSFMLIEKCSNNVAEYQALILGLEMAIEMKFVELKVF